MGRFLGYRGRLVGSQVVCTGAESVLLSGTATLHRRALLLGGLRVPMHHIPTNMCHLPASMLLLLPQA